MAFEKRNATAYERNVWHVIYTNVLADFANLTFLKPDFEILAFLNTLDHFRKSKEVGQNLAFGQFFYKTTNGV